MSGPFHQRIIEVALILAESDMNQACAAAGIASALMLGQASINSPEENFERALENILKLYEEAARDERRAILEFLA